MKEHLKRRIEYSKDAILFEDAPEYESIKKIHEERIRQNPKLKKLLREKFKTAISTLEVQILNGIGLNMSCELRFFLNEFNNRSWNFGHRKMPIMFNILEAFFNLDKNLNYWELLEEEEYLISYFDFIDYYTSKTFNYDIDSIKESFTEGLIYNYNIGAEISELTFKTEDGNEFVIAGISMVRRGNEVNFLFLSGEITDTSKITSELCPLSRSFRVPGKEQITPAEDRNREAVKLNDNPNWWKVLIACRLDLETETIDARYVAKDEGNSYAVKTDDVTGFLRNGQWITQELKTLFENTIIEIEKYNSIFELAKASLYLPQYFNDFEDKITEEEHETSLKSIISNPLKKSKHKNVDPKFKLRNRPLWLLNRKNIFSSDRVILRDDKFKIEASGYWKELSPDEVGIDKKGIKITGRTWVNKIESYYQAKTDELIVTKIKQEKEFVGKNAGYIYVMRNATFEKNIYKIGLTMKDTNERAKQLSKTSVPDHFCIIRDWIVKDCIQAEKEIHKLLNEYRIDPRREFFQVDMKIANTTIDGVVEKINAAME